MLLSLHRMECVCLKFVKAVHLLPVVAGDSVTPCGGAVYKLLLIAPSIESPSARVNFTMGDRIFGTDFPITLELMCYKVYMLKQGNVH